MAGSGIEFDDRGLHSPKGIAEPWPLYAVTRCQPIDLPVIAERSAGTG